ncbi:MAG: hypothetical protein ACKVOT_05430, partial [Polaromonas sp.]
SSPGVIVSTLFAGSQPPDQRCQGRDGHHAPRVARMPMRAAKTWQIMGKYGTRAHWERARRY